MNLINETAAGINVKPTKLTRSLVIDGISEVHPVYKVRLDALRYNPQNDRIATWVSKYKAENGGMLPSESDAEVYNDLIEGFIVESNEEAIRKTANHIKAFGQQVAAVVLSNGLIVDGNRRFTCLRRLAKEDASFGWIDAVVLDESVAANPKSIKMLELSIQHGEEEKVGYSFIDRLVGVYNDVIANGLLTVEEYARATNDTVKNVEKMVEQAQMMVDYLRFLNAEGQFHLAREMEAGAPIQELPKLLRKIKDEDLREVAKACVFANMVVEPKGDMTRFVRKMGEVMASPDGEAFIEEESVLAEEVCERLAAMDPVTREAIRDEIRSDIDLVGRFADAMAVAQDRISNAKLADSPVKALETAAATLEGVDVFILENVDPEAAMRALEATARIEAALEEIRKTITAE